MSSSSGSSHARLDTTEPSSSRSPYKATIEDEEADGDLADKVDLVDGLLESDPLNGDLDGQ